MNTFIAVLQVSAKNFEVFKFNGNNQKSIYPQIREKGILVSCWESNNQNDKYCFQLCENMNNGKN